MIFDVLSRIEAAPRQNDLGRGWAAELADPLWLLGRQWQLGEHMGEDSASPVAVDVELRTVPIEPLEGQPHLPPAQVPAEAILECEPNDWWTVGRRIRLGRTVATKAEDSGLTLEPIEAILLDDLPPPYDAMGRSGFDGLKLWQQRAALGLDGQWFGTPAPPASEPVDLWDPSELVYNGRFPVAGTSLEVERHDGGELDWFSADAKAAIPATAGQSETIHTTPGRLHYPGAPLARWWQIEDANVSIGGQGPDRASLATMVLIDLIVSHSNDWFTFSLPGKSGEILILDQVQVVDAFGDAWPVEPPDDWSLFATKGLDRHALVLWSTARSPIAGPLLDEVIVGIDEDSNMLWAVEQIVRGRSIAAGLTSYPGRPQAASDAERPAFDYVPMTQVPAHWHPYPVDEDVEGRRAFVQGRVMDLAHPAGELLAPPVSDLLNDPKGGNGKPLHRLEPAAVPSEGLRIERRAMLARSTTGEPILWTQRRRSRLLHPPAFALRFDILRPY